MDNKIETQMDEQMDKYDDLKGGQKRRYYCEDWARQGNELLGNDHLIKKKKKHIRKRKRKIDGDRKEEGKKREKSNFSLYDIG